MEYVGKAQRLRSGDIAKIAGSFGLTEAHLQTVIEVETSGRGFDSNGHPTFLFEPHLFYKNVPKNELASAVKQGLAYPKWKGPGSYPKTPTLRWQQFMQAVQLNEVAAIKSASWGLGQILGSEYDEAGYDSPQEMLTAFCDSEYNQVVGMGNLIKRRKLDKVLLRFPDMTACRQFAKVYNGAAYEKNKYHTKLHDAYVRWAARKPAPLDDGILRIGSYDQDSNGPIRQAQQMLKDKGYSILVDGKYGPGTRTTVLAWQANNDRPTTGELSPDDLEALPTTPDMPIPEERATATLEDIKDQSSIVRDSSTFKKTAGWTLTTMGIGKGLESSDLLDKSQDYIDKANQARGIWTSVRSFLVSSGIADGIQFLLAYKFEILVVLVIVGFFVMTKIQKSRLEMHKKAEIG